MHYKLLAFKCWLPKGDKSFGYWRYWAAGPNEISKFYKPRFILYIFCSFQKQRDPRLNEILFPEYNRKSVTKIIKTYELDSEYKNKSKYCIFWISKKKNMSFVSDDKIQQNYIFSPLIHSQWDIFHFVNDVILL